jgi:hypothetical protein
MPMAPTRFKSIHSLDDESCALIVERNGIDVEIVCRIVVGRGVRMVTSEPDEFDRLGLPPRKLAAAVIAFNMEMNSKSSAKVIKSLEVVGKDLYRAEFHTESTTEPLVVDVCFRDADGIKWLQFEPDGFLMRGEASSRELTSIIMAFHELQHPLSAQPPHPQQKTP